ncbi:MAG: type II CAAX endopeptidase family protein, partial [Crocosphaera sp.]
NRLYEVENRKDDLIILQEKQQELAKQGIIKLTFVAIIPVLGGLIGVGIIIFSLIQLFLKKESGILAIDKRFKWETPWTIEIPWQVFIVGFFFFGQIVLPILFTFLSVDLTQLSLRGKAVYVLSSYVTMSLGGIGVLYLSIKPFFPLPKDWFKFKWLSNWMLWGFGGYLVALPLVVIVSLINQNIWDGQGGSNPLLSLALEGQDLVVLAIFYFTAAIAAPFYEEIMFRGFLLPSLTRYIPLWGAIGISSFIFALAHLNLSEVLPLTILGVVLGVVYTRSRNLLSSMLLHSLWNSGTLISLFLLGSGGN